MALNDMRPLSDEEWLALDAFLLAGDEAAPRLPLEEAHGYLTALIVSRAPVPVEAWQTAIWGESPVADAAQQQRMAELLLRMWNEIAVTLEQGQDFEPLVIVEEQDGEQFETVDGWCFGFMQAVADYPERWEALQGPARELVQPIAALALQDDEEAEALDEEEYELCAELLPGSVQGLYAHWTANPV